MAGDEGPGNVLDGGILSFFAGECRSDVRGGVGGRRDKETEPGSSGCQASRVRGPGVAPWSKERETRPRQARARDLARDFFLEMRTSAPGPSFTHLGCPRAARPRWPLTVRRASRPSSERRL